MVATVGWASGSGNAVRRCGELSRTRGSEGVA